MKKNLGIILFMVIHYSTWGQSYVTSHGPCNDAMTQAAKGKWINSHENVGVVAPTAKHEAYKRLNMLHTILQKMYPDPKGVDVRVTRSAGICYFGSTRKYQRNGDGQISFDYLKLLPITAYAYFANFSPHYCAQTNKGLVFMPGNKNENKDGVGLSVNDFSALVDGPSPDDDWTINGLPVKRLDPRLNETWKGYELHGSIHASHVLIHRKGMMPYRPVTRKQYLDRCIIHHASIWDDIISQFGQIPVRSQDEQEKEKKAKIAKFEKDFATDPKRLKSNVDYYLSGYKTDQQLKDERIENAKRNKEHELKNFTDELEKTTREGLMDSPAVILAMYYSTPAVFETNPEKGFVLVVENPGYIKKDLPGFTPQFMVLNWSWNPDTYPVHKGYQKLFLQNFPIENLQSMIDK